MSKPKITADAAYENAHLVAQDMIAKLTEVLFEMPAPGDDTASPINWGHVGTLERHAEHLRQITDSAFKEGEYAE